MKSYWMATKVGEDIWYTCAKCGWDDLNADEYCIGCGRLMEFIDYDMEKLINGIKEPSCFYN